MNTTLRYLAIIVVCATVIFALAKIFNPKPSDRTATVIEPRDTNFVPVKKVEERKVSDIPFQKPRIHKRLPSNIKEKDVKQITEIVLRDSLGHRDTLDLIDTEEGDLYLLKDRKVESITVTSFKPAVFDLDWRYGFGVSLGWTERRPLISPALVFSPVRWYGLFDAPTLTADLDGLGIGIQTRLYYDINLGLSHTWGWTEGRYLKVSLHFML